VYRGGRVGRGEQANKSIWWMPWQPGPKKDVVTLRKAPGSRLQADPEISEWGNPSTVMSRDPRKREASGGTETSKYPEEKKQFP
jgi:hypothetical protein